MNPTPEPKIAESDTPRTDALLAQNYCGRKSDDNYGDDWSSQDILDVMAHAKQLERELKTCREAALKEAAEIVEKEKIALKFPSDFAFNDALRIASRQILSAIKKEQE